MANGSMSSMMRICDFGTRPALGAAGAEQQSGAGEEDDWAGEEEASGLESG